MTYLAHQSPCPACQARLLFVHCNPCHRLFLHCEGCEAAFAEARQPSGDAAPSGEHPTCPRCGSLDARPATRSDLENRDMLGLLAL